MTHDTTPRDEPSDESDDGRTADVETLERRLTNRREPYARATIVRREPPVSANVGDRAVITADGELHGWIGGVSCAQSVVSAEAQAALERGEPRLLGIAPDPDRIDRAGLETFPMRCHSEGVLEVFVEPVNTAPDLLIVGDSPVSRSLARLAGELTFDVTIVAADGDEGLEGNLPAGTAVRFSTDPDAIADAVDGEPIVVVASMGGFDARGVAAAVLADALYVGLVASGTRATEVIERAASLLECDPTTVREVVTNPAGVDVSAYTPAEIAASVLAEVVDVRATVGGTSGNYTPPTCDAHDAPEESEREGSDGVADVSSHDPAVDPVCGATVDPADAPASREHDGRTYHFCCPGCVDSFDSDPESHLDVPNGAASTP
ncbi:XdhC family protein [Natrarchaeobius oligotrophus]|uniref:YHS domain-containing protein n=1 Tax=Natrarchaeobius chitinivorans TaxID=1679083 RepID=A0A3N6PUL8_NATCH|nr:XdhC family protein [Natrarchaeobius chitinivorans]RQH03496.1 YHS domain-containing protein [Natrarchaeobius chitinivorans]